MQGWQRSDSNPGWRCAGGPNGVPEHPDQAGLEVVEAALARRSGAGTRWCGRREPKSGPGSTTATHLGSKATWRGSGTRRGGRRRRRRRLTPRRDRFWRTCDHPDRCGADGAVSGSMRQRWMRGDRPRLKLGCCARMRTRCHRRKPTHPVPRQVTTCQNCSLAVHVYSSHEYSRGRRLSSRQTRRRCKESPETPSPFDNEVPGGRRSGESKIVHRIRVSRWLCQTTSRSWLHGCPMPGVGVLATSGARSI